MREETTTYVVVTVVVEGLEVKVVDFDFLLSEGVRNRPSRDIREVKEAGVVALVVKN